MQIAGWLTIPSEHDFHDLIRAQWAACQTAGQPVNCGCGARSRRVTGRKDTLPVFLQFSAPILTRRKTKAIQKRV